jgi:hypothetical protein
MKGEYNSGGLDLDTDGQYGHLQLHKNGALKVGVSQAPDDSFSYLAGTGSTSGKLPADAVANSGILYVTMPNPDAKAYIDWLITSDVQYTYQLGRNLSHPLGCTLTLTDATGVDDGDTFLLNSLTFTAESTESDATAAARKYYIPSQVLAATNLRTLLLDATYGVPGIASIVQTAPTTTDVLTIACDEDCTALCFGQGTSAANEVAYADLAGASFCADAAVSSNIAATTGTKGNVVTQTIGGWSFGILKLTNTSGAAAANFHVRAVSR